MNTKKNCFPSFPTNIICLRCTIQPCIDISLSLYGHDYVCVYLMGLTQSAITPNACETVMIHSMAMIFGKI